MAVQKSRVSRSRITNRLYAFKIKKKNYLISKVFLKTSLIFSRVDPEFFDINEGNVDERQQWKIIRFGRPSFIYTRKFRRRIYKTFM